MAHPLLEKMNALREEAKVAIKEEFKNFFAKHPQVESIVWTQYAPYFNDGDACVFRVHEFSFKGTLGEVKTGSSSEENEDEDDDWDDDEEDDLRSRINEAVGYEWSDEKREYVHGTIRPLTPEEESFINDADELEELCHELQNEMKILFGADAQITATRDGFEADDYQHD